MDLHLSPKKHYKAVYSEAREGIYGNCYGALLDPFNKKKVLQRMSFIMAHHLGAILFLIRVILQPSPSSRATHPWQTILFPYLWIKQLRFCDSMQNKIGMAILKRKIISKLFFLLGERPPIYPFLCHEKMAVTRMLYPHIGKSLFSFMISIWKKFSYSLVWIRFASAYTNKLNFHFIKQQIVKAMRD